MKKILVWSLVLLFVSHTAVLGLGLDKDKLMTLTPLCSERVSSQASEYEKAKPWAALTTGVLGLGYMQANSGGTIDNSKLTALFFGMMTVMGGAMVYCIPGEPVIQNNTLLATGLSGVEKEEAAYTILKSAAIRSKESRKGSGLLMIGSGIGLALLTSMANGATQSYKDNMNTGAAVFALLGLLAYLNPAPNEREMDQVDGYLGLNIK